MRAEIPYVGIRVTTPFRGMLAARDKLLAEAQTDIKQAAIETVGYGFLRLHVIDMEGPMDLEAGYFTAGPVQTVHGRLRAGAMPAGRYATLSYKNHARRANGALQEWAAANGLTLDRWTVPEGDAFACRYEASARTRRSNRGKPGGRWSCRCGSPTSRRYPTLCI